MAPLRAVRELMGFDPFRGFPERFLEGFDPFRTFGGENWSLATWAPACDIYENNHEIVVKIELPEVKKEDVRVSIENNIDTNKVNAEFKDGVLRVTLGKREEARPKQVEVKVK